jgi:2-polyprenyl-6-methoxyphenol hydroxylase-like FAD-dependent oxidoreductase
MKMAMQRKETDVIVVGAGPVGLLLAGELRLAGVGVTVIDKLAAPTGESRASQLNARTMEIFDQRGLLGWLAAPEREERGHFGGLPLPVSGLDSSYAGHWKIPQYRTEAALQRWATELGAELLRGHELAGLEVTGDRVEALARTAAGELRLVAGYLAGCDGEDSTVRRLGGFGFAGHDAGAELLRADVSGVDIPDRRFERLERGLAIAATRGGVTRVMMHRFGRPAIARTGPPDFGEIAATWAEITGEDLRGGKLIWADAFGDTCRQATQYRRGRLLLAGDAAHRMMPVGGQALNLGLQDAANLGWKLAAQVNGWAPPGLLDSYHTERHPVGARVLANVEAQKLLLLGDEHTDAVRQVVRELLDIDSGRRHLAEMVSGLDVRYSPGRDGHPLLGARMPGRTLRMAGHTAAVAALLRPARGVLVDCTGGSPRTEPLRAAAAPWRERVDTVLATPAGDGPPLGFDAALLRPDGHIAWVDGDVAGLREALERWFGLPVAVTAGV